MTQPTTRRAHGAVEESDESATVHIDERVFESLSLDLSTGEGDASPRVSRWIETWSGGFR